MTKRTITVCGFVLYLLAAANGNAQDRLAITPGVGLAFARVDAPASEFIEAVGSKVQMSRVDVGSSSQPARQILIYAFEIGVTAVCNDPAPGSGLEVSAIVISNPAFLVRGNGLHVGSQESEVTRLMGSASPADLRLSGYRVLQYPQRGIVFAIGGGAVVSITVRASGTAEIYEQYRGILGMGLAKSELLLAR